MLSVPDRGDRLFSGVFVCFIDVGKEEEVKSYQILQLPEQFHSLSGQAVEIIVCQVKPVDAETNWHPKVSLHRPIHSHYTLNKMISLYCFPMYKNLFQCCILYTSLDIFLVL